MTNTLDTADILSEHHTYDSDLLPSVIADNYVQQLSPPHLERHLSLRLLNSLTKSCSVCFLSAFCGAILGIYTICKISIFALLTSFVVL